MSATLTSQPVRQAVAADPEVGGGNALPTAVGISPDPDAPFLLAQPPIRDRSGQDRGELSLRELADLAGAWSAWYAGRGVGPRDRVGIYLRDSADDLVHYLALSRLGAIAVLVNGELAPAVAAGHFRRTGAVGVQADGDHRASLAAAGWPEAGKPWVSAHTEVSLPGAGPVPPPYRHSPGDPVLICHTSGTTGTPKPVIWTHGQMMAGIRGHLTRFPCHPESLVLSALPQSHASAIGYAVLAMLTGTPLALVSDRSGPAVAVAADRYRATVVAGFASTFADLALHGLGAGRLETVERWVSVGDASHHAHVAELVRRGRHFAGGSPRPGSMFVDGFGSSELGWGGILGMVTVSGAPVRYRCIGTAQSFAEVTILRPDGTPAEPHEVGLLAVKGPVVTPGYWNDSDLTYRSMLGGYWLSGDLAYRDEAQRFYHVDRAADMIRTAAGPVYSVLTEEILLAHLPEIADCAVFAAAAGGPPEAVGLVQLRDGRPADGLLHRANEILARLGQPPLAGLHVTGGDRAIPVGVTGKVLKRQLRSAAAQGQRGAPPPPGGPAASPGPRDLAP